MRLAVPLGGGELSPGRCRLGEAASCRFTPLGTGPRNSSAVIAFEACRREFVDVDLEGAAAVGAGSGASMFSGGVTIAFTRRRAPADDPEELEDAEVAEAARAAAVASCSCACDQASSLAMFLLRAGLLVLALTSVFEDTRNSAAVPERPAERLRQGVGMCT